LRIRDCGCGIGDAGCGIRDWRIRDQGLGILGPDRRRRDVRFRRAAGIRAAAAFEAADRSDGHGVIADDLARKADARDAARRQNVALGDGHAIRLAFDEFHAARRAAGITAAGVKLIDLRVLLEGEDEAFSVLHLDGAESFHR
jgi:hypothetical protein